MNDTLVRMLGYIALSLYDHFVDLLLERERDDDVGEVRYY